MKITIIQGAFFPVPPIMGGAVEKLWYGLGREFARAGHEVTHISRRHLELPDQENNGGVNYLRVKGEHSTNNIPLLKLRDFFYTRRVLPLLPQADILISNTFWLPLLLSDPSRGKVIISVERMPKGQMRFYGRASIFRACSTVVADAVRAELLPEDKRVRMIPNPLPHRVESSIHLSRKQPIILYVGRIHPKKGIELLLRAAMNLPSPWKVVIVGPHDEARGGGGEAYLEKLKSMVGKATVEFRGPIFNDEKLISFYEEASLFAYPSVDGAGEAMPIAPLEAMAQGCVPIVSALDCFADFVSDGVNGLVFDHHASDPVAALHEEIARLCSDPALRERLALRAMEVRHSHSLGGIAEKFLHLFSGIVSMKFKDSISE